MDNLFMYSMIGMFIMPTNMACKHDDGSIGVIITSSISNCMHCLSIRPMSWPVATPNSVCTASTLNAWDFKYVYIFCIMIAMQMMMLSEMMPAASMGIWYGDINILMMFS